MDALETIVLERQGRVSIGCAAQEWQDNDCLIATMMRNIEDLGFTFSKETVEMLHYLPQEEMQEWYTSLEGKLKEMSGTNHEYHPFYPNFPEEVMEKSEVEMYFERVFHYLTGALPAWENEKEGRKSLEGHELKILGYCPDVEKAVTDMVNNLLRGKTDLPQHETDGIIRPFIENVENWNEKIDSVANRNNLCLLYTEGLKAGKKVQDLPELVAKDYLRIASNLRAGGVRSFPRPIRRFIASGLDKCKNLEEDVAREKTAFKKLFKDIHVGEMKSRYPNCFHVADKLRSGGKLETFYQKVEAAYAEKDYDRMAGILKSRPGEFVKRLDAMVRDNGQPEKVLEIWEEVAKKVRTEDLVSCMEYFKARGRVRPCIHKVKGKFIPQTVSAADSDGKRQCFVKVLPPLDEKVAESIIVSAKAAFAGQMATGREFGLAYIDPALKDVPLPKDRRDSSKSLASYPKGSALKLEKDGKGEAKNVRAFIWWTNGNFRTDIDLSAKFFKKTEMETGKDGSGTMFACKMPLEECGELAYYTCKNIYGCLHSGDITNGGPADGDGVCEYIDLDMEALKENGVDYVMLYVNSYSGQPYCELPHCEFGWMERSEMGKTAQFDPRAVKQHSKLTGEHLGETTCFLDVNGGKMIWIDAPDFQIRAMGDVSLTGLRAQLLFERYASGDRMSLAEAAETVVLANGGEVVDAPEKANTVFMLDAVDTAGMPEGQKVITAKEQDVWVGEFMVPYVVAEDAGGEETKAGEVTEPVVVAKQENMVIIELPTVGESDDLCENEDLDEFVGR